MSKKSWASFASTLPRVNHQRWVPGAQIQVNIANISGVKQIPLLFPLTYEFDSH